MQYGIPKEKTVQESLQEKVEQIWLELQEIKAILQEIFQEEDSTEEVRNENPKDE